MNSIINLNRGDNSMNLLTFHWIATFEDRSNIYQFDKYGNECRFQLVKDKFDKLICFILTNDKDKSFIVDLTKGIIGYNEVGFENKESKEIKKNVRLIFFRRNTITIGTNDLKVNNHTVVYHLGFQYNNLKGNNRKIILQINSDGSFIIE